MNRYIMIFSVSLFVFTMLIFTVESGYANNHKSEIHIQQLKSPQNKQSNLFEELKLLQKEPQNPVVASYNDVKKDGPSLVKELKLLQNKRKSPVIASYNDVKQESLENFSNADVEGRKIYKERLAVVREEEVQPPPATGDDQTVYLSPDDGIDIEDDDNLFGMKKGYFHPSVSISLSSTENLYNVDEDKTSSWVFAISPSVWMSVPRRRKQPMALPTHNTSAGGLLLMLDDYVTSERYQFFLKTGFDYKQYSADEDLNDFTWAGIEGLAEYNFPGGLSLQLVDKFNRSQDRFEYGYQDSSLDHIFYSNNLIATADWAITEKLRIKGDLNLFWLRYDEEEFDYLERDDLFVDLYGYFNWTEKTSFFINYKPGFLAFDSYEEYDNEQTFLYGGVSWLSTEKLSFKFKIGHQSKQFTDDNSTFKDYSGLALETQAGYRFSEKTNFGLLLTYKNDETDSLQAQDKQVTGATLRYSQSYTEKLKGSLRAMYEYADYTELVEQERDEWRIVLEPGLQYAFRDWLGLGLVLKYDMRESTDDDFDYEATTILLKLDLGLDYEL